MGENQRNGIEGQVNTPEEGQKGNKLQDRLITARCGSQSWHSEAFPNALIGILHEDTTASTMARFHTAVRALQECRKQGYRKCQAMAKRSPLNSPRSMWLIAFAQATGFETVLPQLRVMVVRPKFGLNQSLINEKANRILKGEARVSCGNNILGEMRMWRGLVCDALFAEFGRVEIAPTTAAPPPTS